MKEKLLNYIRIAFCVSFFCLFAFFSVGILIPDASKAAEGAVMPKFITDGKISDNFGGEFETWFSRRFAYRGKVVDLFSSLKETVFKTGNEQVIVGDDGFLFFADTLSDYTRSAPLTEEELAGIADSLSALSDYAKEHGTQFLFVCAPNKNTIYGEYMPDRYGRLTEASNLDLLYAYLDAHTDVPYVDVRPILNEAKADGTLLYHKRDSHWNGLGAHIAYEAVMDALGVSSPDFSVFPTVSTDTFEGDLDRLLYPGSVRYDNNVTYALSEQFVYTSAFATEMDMEITTRSAGEAGRLLMFRDSYASAWLSDFAVTFSDCRFERAVPYCIDQIAGDAYDAVIVEIAERNLRSLIGCDESISTVKEDT